LHLGSEAAPRAGNTPPSTTRLHTPGRAAGASAARAQRSGAIVRGTHHPLMRVLHTEVAFDLAQVVERRLRIAPIFCGALAGDVDHSLTHVLPRVQGLRLAWSGVGQVQRPRRDTEP